MAGHQAVPLVQNPSIRLRAKSRHALLLGTALASTLLIATLTAPAPASAQVTCLPGDPGVTGTTGPIVIGPNAGPIDCMNVFDRENNGDPVIELRSDDPAQPIVLKNYGDLTSADNRGILVYSEGATSRVEVINTGDLDTDASAIYARTRGADSELYVYNSGHITGVYKGIWAVTGVGGADGGPIEIINTGDIDLQTGESIDAASYGVDSDIYVFNSGALTGETGIRGGADGDDADVKIVNTGNITVQTDDDPSFGISAANYSGENSRVTIHNSGEIMVTGTGGLPATGISAEAVGNASSVRVTNSADIRTTAGGDAFGIFALANGSVSVTNSGDIHATAGTIANGISAQTDGAGSSIGLVNSGDIYVTGNTFAAGIYAQTQGANSPINIANSGSIRVTGPAGAVGIDAVSFWTNSPIVIENSGSILGGTAGVSAKSAAPTTIINSGDIGASSNRAIVVPYGPVDIFNTGTITGFVLLDADDTFINQAGGVFEARQTSDFDAYGGGGTDLFVNEAGGTVHATGDTRFVNLERFENQGLISMVDGAPGDSFTISNTPGGTDLNFAASGNSRLAVDAHLGGPGSRSDTFTIEGDVSGVTTVSVVNTNYGPGVFNPSGMRVVTVTGATPNPDAFKLDESIDTGFFNYDLFFTPTGSGHWDLRSFAGPGAFLLPQLVTAAQDIWHQSASTWFDRTADLRVLLAGGPAPTAYDPGGKSLSAAEPYALTPAVWARGSGSWLDRDGTERTTAYGRDYTFDMDRELQTLDFQVGVDLGKRDALTQGDALVFGLLGGLVHGDLDYDALARNFNFDGGQVGVYATYLNGGLFVDTLANMHLYSLETSTLGFPNALDANTVGLRTDTGYRFGSFSGGPFIEPLATLEVTWADIDGFSLGGNTVSFDDDANVRGRLGLRAGTTLAAWEGTLMEPFVTGSLWGNLTDDNSATLVSTGRTFRFEDRLEDVWGEVSAGVNVFNFSQTTAVFAKVDVTFGDDLTGVGGKAGMRVNW